MIRIALVGSTGRIGSRIANEARTRGHHVLEVLRANVEIFDPYALSKVLRGSDVLVSAYRAPEAEPPKLPQATRSMLQASESAGLTRVLTVGGCGGLTIPEGGRLADTDDFPAELLPKVKAHEEAVDLLASSCIAWTCIAPPEHIGPGERTGRYRLAPAALVRDAAGRSTISYEDFACGVVDELEAAQHLRKLLGAGY